MIGRGAALFLLSPFYFFFSHVAYGPQTLGTVAWPHRGAWRPAAWLKHADEGQCTSASSTLRPPPRTNRRFRRTRAKMLSWKIINFGDCQSTLDARLHFLSLGRRIAAAVRTCGTEARTGRTGRCGTVVIVHRDSTWKPCARTKRPTPPPPSGLG